MTAFPHIWIPQRPWRSPLEWFTAGKGQRNPSNGKAKRRASNGKLRRNTGSITTCCCGPTCALCTPARPTLTLTISSAITICAGSCYKQSFPNVNSAVVNSPSSLASGTYDVPFFFGDATFCQWVLLAPSVVSGVFYLNSTVCGGATTTALDYLQIVITKFNTGSYGVALAAADGVGSRAAGLFEASTTTALCAPASPLSNRFSACADQTILDVAKYGFGGAVTIT